MPLRGSPTIGIGGLVAFDEHCATSRNRVEDDLARFVAIDEVAVVDPTADADRDAFMFVVSALFDEFLFATALAHHQAMLRINTRPPRARRRVEGVVQGVGARRRKSMFWNLSTVIDEFAVIPVRLVVVPVDLPECP